MHRTRTPGLCDISQPLPTRTTRLIGAASSAAVLAIVLTAAGQAEAQMVSAPSDVLNPSQFGNQIGSLDASWDAYDRVERKRKNAFEWQIYQSQALSARPSVGVFGWAPAGGPLLPRFHRWRTRHLAPPVATPVTPPAVGPIPAAPVPSVAPRSLLPPSYQPIEQPIGHIHKETGPNSYVYRPLYADEVYGRPPRPEVHGGVDLYRDSTGRRYGDTTGRSNGRPVPSASSNQFVPNPPRPLDVAPLDLNRLLPNDPPTPDAPNDGANDGAAQPDEQPTNGPREF